MGFLSSTAGGSKAEESKDDIIQNLMRDLVQTKDRAAYLEVQAHTATTARKAAENRIRELEDVLKLKERVLDDYDRQLSHAEIRAADMASQIEVNENELAAIALERSEHPLSNLDLQHRHARQSDLFETLQEALTCPICYSPFGKGEAISLLCGHTFCDGCFANWEAKHLDVFRNSPATGVYTGADCPECRSRDVRKGKVRIWALEEAIRVVAKGVKESERLYVPPPVPVEGEASGGDGGVARSESVAMAADDAPPLNSEEEDAARLLRPRSPLPYRGVS